MIMNYEGVKLGIFYILFYPPIPGNSFLHKNDTPISLSPSILCDVVLYSNQLELLDYQFFSSPTLVNKAKILNWRNNDVAMIYPILGPSPVRFACLFFSYLLVNLSQNHPSQLR